METKKLNIEELLNDIAVDYVINGIIYKDEDSIKDFLDFAAEKKQENSNIFSWFNCNFDYIDDIVKKQKIDIDTQDFSILDIVDIAQFLQFQEELYNDIYNIVLYISLNHLYIDCSILSIEQQQYDNLLNLVGSFTICDSISIVIKQVEDLLQII